MKEELTIEHQQVKRFDHTFNSTIDCNKFLKEIGTRVITVTPISTEPGGMEYIVTYWC